MNRLSTAAVTAGAFATAGLAARVLTDRRADARRRRRGEDVEFGSVRGPVATVVGHDGVRINVEVDPPGPEADPDLTIVFVHGWMCDLDTWHYQRLALRGQARLILVDQRGHGRSDATTAASSTLHDLADDLARVIAEQAPTGRVVLVGHSMGGMTIMRLAIDRPDLFGDRVAGAVLIGTSAGRLVRGNPVLLRFGRLIRAASPLLDQGRAFNSYSVIKRWAVGPGAAEKHADMANEMILRAPSRVVADFYPNFPTLDLTAGLDVLGRVPVALVCGTDDLMTPAKHSRRLAADIPGAALTLIPGAGHMVMLEAAGQVTAVIEGLMREVAR